MDGVATAATADADAGATADPDASATASLPPHDSDSIPVGSPEDPCEEAAVNFLPFDEDHENEPDHNHDEDHGHDNQSSGPTAQTEDLKHKIIRQVEYYFCDENLRTDKYMISMIKKNKEGYVPISVIASFNKMKKLTRDYGFIAGALRESSFLVVNSDGKKVKRLHPFPLTEFKDSKFCTILVENLPEDHSLENLQQIFGEAGKIRKISVHDPLAVVEPKKIIKADILLSSKLHALVEYDTVEAAEKAVATLNDEQDWRNGMRVKLLKQMGKHGQRKAWREPDSEKSSNGRSANQTGEEENHNSSEHHDDTPDEEDAEHATKEKNGQQGRNRGRSRRNKSRVTNGMGHGKSSSSHAVEPSKPPPGPKMPDGTRGFTMGRGRPPLPNQSYQSSLSLHLV